MRKRKIQANYLKVAEAFEKLSLSFTEATESPSAQTASKRYIDQSSATQTVTGYEWSVSFNTDQIENNVVVEYIQDIGEMLKVGTDTETEYLIVDLDKPGTVEGTYRARKFNIAVQVDSFDDNDAELGISGTFLGQGDPVEGTFTLAAKTFAEGFTAAV